MAQKEHTLIQIKRFGKNPGNLKMFIHYKATQDSVKVPLVVVLHGCSQKAAGMAELTGWNKLADIHNFAVLYPQQKSINNPALCFNWFRNKDIRKNKGECASIFQMIKYAKSHYPIDSRMVFITGVSAGAAMSVVLMATYPEVFKMGAVYAGGAYGLMNKSISALKAMGGYENISVERLTTSVRNENPFYEGTYPPLIIYQGQNDPVVAPRNAHILAAQWAGLYNADTANHTSEYGYTGIGDITRMVYKDSSGNVYIIMYEIAHLGHCILVKPGNEAHEGGKTGLYGVDKGFHSTYHTAKEFGIVK